jgi:L-alanine-DL-glutamate epimerase-like enolase superfamily enzyme
MFGIKYWHKNLAFKYPFTISKGTKTLQSTFIVELNFRGIKGYGEAPAISYYNISVEQMIADLENKRKFIESFSLTDPKRFWHFLHHLFPANPFLVCALDMAGWDIFGKLNKQPLYKIWKLDPEKAPQTDYTIGIDEPELMLEKMRKYPAQIYKIKVGSKDDIQKLNFLRKQSDAQFRIDANGGWSFEDAKSYLPELEQIGIEIIEQPLFKDSYEETKELKRLTKIPIYADESFINEKELSKCAESFTGINIKLTKCSGITPSIEIISKARKLGLGIMLGCMNESSIGTAALANLAPLVDYLDADGPLLLKEDVATGITYEKNYLKTLGSPGLGIQPQDL